MSSGIWSLSNFDDSHKESQKVKVTTLKNKLGDLKINHIDFLEADTEGLDFSVLKGIDWDRINIESIVCEFEDKKFKLNGHTTDDLIKFLIDKGYNVIISEWNPIEQYGKNHIWNRISIYNNEYGGEKVWGNIIALKESAYDMFIKT